MAEKTVSAQADAPATPSANLLARLNLSVAGTCDIASLADELGEICRRLHAKDGDNSALAAEVLAARVSMLANAVCSALDDEGDDVEELQRIVYSGRAAPSIKSAGAASMLAAALAEGAPAT